MIMSTYNKPCIHCGERIDGDSKYCAKCGSRTPFGFICPNCLKPIERGNLLCSGCGRKLTVNCPLCKAETFVGSGKCEACGRSLLVKCENKRCGELQFFELTKCTVCGKAIKKGESVLIKMYKKEMK